MKISKRIISLALAAVMIFSCFMIQSIAAQTYKVNVTVKYGQTEARTMLGMINSFRTGNDAWCWDNTNTQKVKYTGLGNIVYDYELEKAAMQRAAELVVYYSHTRPDGSACFTAYNTGMAAGENIAMGMNSVKTASSAFTLWQETDKNYAGQGHRRNMLDSKFGAIGIGYATYNNYTCWVQEFRNAPISTTQITANDSSAVVPVNILDSEITFKSVAAPNLSISLETSGSKASAALPSLNGEVRMKETWIAGNIKVGIPCTWTSSDEKVVKISDGKAVAVGAGSATVSANALGEKITVPVTVKDNAVKKGDVDNDGNINSSDALLVLRCSVGSITLSADQKTRADVDGNNAVNSSDALKILQYSVGQIKTL